MRLYHAIQIERFIEQMIQNDRDILKVCGGYEVEKDEIVKIMIQHFRSMGIYTVYPMNYAGLLKSHLLHALVHSPALRERRTAIQKHIEKVREKSRRMV